MTEQTAPSPSDSTRYGRDDSVDLFGASPGADVLPLPGLELAGSRGPAQAGELEQAVLATLKALAEENTLSPRDAARVRLAVSLARIITDKERSGKTSTVGNDARVLLELLDGLAPAAAAEGDAALRAAMDQWAREEAADRAARASGVPDAAPA